MNSRTDAPSAPRPSTEVTCSGCGVQTTVPFTPTPGRPVYCRACFVKRPAPAGRPSGGPGDGPRRGPPGGGFRSDYQRPPPTARKKMLAQGRKSHFVYDVREVLSHGKMLEENRRAFIEMLFIRGARGSTEDAQLFLEEKLKDQTITFEEAERISRLVDRYSFWR